MNPPESLEADMNILRALLVQGRTEAKDYSPRHGSDKFKSNFAEKYYATPITARTRPGNVKSRDPCEFEKRGRKRDRSSIDDEKTEGKTKKTGKLSMPKLKTATAEVAVAATNRRGVSLRTHNAAETIVNAPNLII